MKLAVDKPTNNRIYVNTNVLQTFSENDIEFAEQIAKLSLNEEKEIEMSNQKMKSKAISFEVNCDQDHILESKDNEKEHTFTKSVSNQEKHTVGRRSQNNREGNMRIKQAVRIAHDISRLMESLEKKSKKKSSLEFITPLELEKKEKHWQEFYHSARRSLYSLKREVRELSVKITAPLGKVSDNLLRTLSSSTRSCFQLLKGLENFESKIRIGENGNIFLRETLLIAQQLLFIITVGGGAREVHKFSVPYLKKDADSSFEATEDTLTRSLEVMSSDLDNSRIAALLKPSAVRKKLSSLARTLKAKELQKKHSHSKYLSPLQKELTTSEDSEKCFYPLVEDLDGGRKIEFVNDNLSPKLRKRLPIRGKRKYLYSEDFRPLKTDECNKEKKENNHPTNASSYGVSEEMADAVFEKILPYITSSDDKELLNRQIEKPNLEIYMYLEAQKKLVQLQERFDKLERITEEQKEFLSSINVILSQQSSKLSDVLNIDLAIQKANVCLDNCSKYSFPYHESSAKVVFDNFLLSNTPNEENGFFPQESNIPCMQEDIKALKLEFWNRLNEKIDTNEGVHIRRKDTLPLCNVNGLHIDIPDGNETDKLINIDGQDIFEGKADTEEGMENANINTDTFSEPIKLGSDINTALEHHNGCIEATLICTRVSDVLSKKLSSNSSGNLKMIQNENVNYTEENLSSISKDSLNPKESKSSVSGNIGMENSNHLKYSEDEERNHSYSQKELNEKLLYFKVESEKSVISEDISKNFSSSEVESSN